jgi:putative endonuclease
MKGWMYVLECSDASYYTGSTNNLTLRMEQHQKGEGANYTKKRLPVKLLYYEVFYRIDHAFYREKQVQGWSRKKKEALINTQQEKLHDLAECKNDTHFRNRDSAAFDSAQAPEPTGNRSLSEVETKGSEDERRSLSGAEGKKV